MPTRDRQTRNRRRWIEHWRRCDACRAGPDLCDEGAWLAEMVIEGMAPDECLLCDL